MHRMGRAALAVRAHSSGDEGVKWGLGGLEGDEVKGEGTDLRVGHTELSGFHASL